MTDPDRAVEAILADDMAYFQAGADIVPLDGGVFAHVAAFPGVAAAACAHLLDAERAEADPQAWAARLEAVTREAGRDVMRVYLVAPAPRLGRCLAARGYTRSVEVVLANRVEAWRPPDPGPGFTCRPVRTPQDWEAKRDLHRHTGDIPDGKPTPADEWAAFERFKSETGYMDPHLVYLDDVPVATFSVSIRNGWQRLKNIVVDARVRRRGAGRAAVWYFHDIARRRGVPQAGALAIEGGPGERMYRRCGLHSMGTVNEFFRAADGA